jgi:hypothetical protein
MLVAVMTASNNRKLPKVSRPIESGNDRIRCKIAASAGGMVNETGFKFAICIQLIPLRGEHAGDAGMAMEVSFGALKWRIFGG